LVVDTSTVETSPLSPTEIMLLGVIPNYDNKTHKIISAEISFWIDNPSLIAVGKPILRVGLDGKALESVTVIDGDQSAEESFNVIRDYVPSQGWKTGTYSFYVELLRPDGMLYKTNEQMLYVKSETAAIINWSVLIVIISITLLLSIILEFVLIYRKRHMYNI
jgi:hypothetical protein